MNAERVTLEDVAARARVSRATASRVVRGEQNVSPKKMKAVRKAIAELGYHPNSAARTLVTKRAGVIAIVIPEPDSRVFSDSFFGRTIQAISRELDRRDSQPVLVFFSTPEESRRTEAFLTSGAVDGAIVLSHHQQSGEIDRLRNTFVPTVFIGRLEQDARYWVDSDNYHGGEEAANALIESGCKHPATISGPLNMIAGKDRLAGFTDRLADNNLQAVVHEGDFTYRSGYDAGQKLLPAIVAGEIDGIFVGSDLMASGVLDALKETKTTFSLPIIAFDNSPLAEQLNLTSITNPTEQLAREATNLLEAQLSRTWDGNPVVLPVALIPRRTTHTFRNSQN
ncbi:LacI family DNA-binding transcriptional regulator [Actinomyces urinae]|uniref:LacI family DNA-binding transcriptional regulator n=1 Tax=Actinomyces urinae TaxID=1689268 RepID=UPI00093114E1|nr:LacI family DNA-binding transcriptional regulator [Actinomyces urinae]